MGGVGGLLAICLFLRVFAAGGSSTGVMVADVVVAGGTVAGGSGAGVRAAGVVVAGGMVAGGSSAGVMTAGVGAASSAWSRLVSRICLLFSALWLSSLWY